VYVKKVIEDGNTHIVSCLALVGLPLGVKIIKINILTMFSPKNVEIWPKKWTYIGSQATPNLQVVKGTRNLLFEFWDPLHISGKVGTRNFKFGMQIDHQGY